jgi:hypothetical protein
MCIYPLPQTFNQFVIHRSIVDRLSSYSSTAELPMSSVFIGKPLVGKRTIIQALIRNVVGQPFECKVKKDSIYTHGNTMNIGFVSSPFHIEFHLEEYGLTDRYIVGEYIYRLLSSNTIDDRIRIYVIYGVDNYTYETQDIFVGLIEKHFVNSRFLMTAENKNKLHPRLQSISSITRIGLPSRIEIIAYLKRIPEIRSIANIEEITDRITEEGHLGTLRYTSKYIDPLEMTWNTIVPLIEKKDITSIVDMKPHFYNIITLTLSTTTLLNRMCEYVIDRIPKGHMMHSDILTNFAEIESRMRNVDYDIVGLEYAALLTKHYIHVVFTELKDK